MKKVKKLLVAAIAALSLSSCSLEDIKNFPAQVGSTVSSTFNDLLVKLGLKKKEEEKPAEQKEEQKEEKQDEEGQKQEETCNHVDADHNGICDLCGEAGLVVTHSDADGDHLCDVCGAKVSEHADEDHDHKCDSCGEVLSEHSDSDNDFKCDYCGAELEIAKVELDASGAQLEFARGSEFSSEGVKVIATSSVGSTKELEFTASEPDMSTVGKKEITITATVGEEQQTFTYNISVVYWSEDDLDVFDATSLTSYATLPYMAGHNMRTEVEVDENNSLVDWSIVADDVDDNDVLEYNNMLLDYEEVVELEGYNVSFKLKELALELEDLAEIAEAYNLEEVMSAFVLTPSFVYKENTVRFFNVDEYFLLGVNADGQMVMKNRINNCAFDGMFDSSIGIEYFDGSFSLSAGDADILQLYGESVQDLIGYYYSELSPALVVFPELTDVAAEEVYPANLFSEYPFDNSFDDATLALEFEVWGSSESELTAYFEALLQAGYAYDDEADVYYIGNDLYGNIEISGEFRSVEYQGTTYSWYVFDFFYYEPAYGYTTIIHEDILDLLENLEITSFEFDTDYYEDYGEVDLWSSIPAKEATEDKSAELVTLEGLAADLALLGFEATEAPEMGAYYGIFPAAVASFTDYATLNFTAYVFEPEEGECEIVFEFTKFYSFTIEDVVKAVFGEVVPTELAEGSYSAVVLAYEEGEAEAPTLSKVGPYISAAASGASEIADIDYNILVGDGYYYFSALTKDGKYIFTVYAYAGANGYALELEVEELGLKETIVRNALSSFSSYGPIRFTNYDIDANGTVSASLKFQSGLASTIVNYVYNNILPEDFSVVDAQQYVYDTIPAEEEGGEDTIIYGYIYVFSNGEVDCTLDVVDDGSFTYVSMEVSDTPEEDPGQSQNP